MQNPLSNDVIKQYVNVINAFKNRYDVQNGTRLGYRNNQDPDGELELRNKPHSIGEGLTTTGFCVSVSQALLIDNAFKQLLQYRNATAKLISIDIKEQYWGECYNGSKNTWHTAVLVTDNNINIVIDLTCAQFGNRFIEKFIWTFDTWQKTFRSPICKHKIIDGIGRELNYDLKSSMMVDNHAQSKECCHPTTIENHMDITKEELRQKINKEVLLTSEEVDFMTDFLYEKFNDFNIKLLSGMLNKYDIQYNNILTKCFAKMSLVKTKVPFYYVIPFKNRQAMIDFLKFFEKGNWVLNHNVIAKNKIEDNEYYNLNSRDMRDDQTHYIVFEFVSPVEAVDINDIWKDCIIIPYGTQLEIDPKEGIYNGVKLLSESILNTQKTNTTYIRI